MNTATMQGRPLERRDQFRTQSVNSVSQTKPETGSSSVGKTLEAIGGFAVSLVKFVANNPVTTLTLLLASSSQVVGGHQGHLRGNNAQFGRQLDASYTAPSIYDSRSTWDAHSFSRIAENQGTLTEQSSLLIANNPTIVDTVKSSPYTAAFNETLQNVTTYLLFNSSATFGQGLRTVLSDPSGTAYQGDTLTKAYVNFQTALLVSANGYRGDGVVFVPSGSGGLAVTVGDKYSSPVTGDIQSEFNSPKVALPAGTRVAVSVFPANGNNASTLTFSGTGKETLDGRPLAFTVVDPASYDTNPAGTVLNKIDYSEVVPLAGTHNGYQTLYSVTATTSGNLDQFSSVLTNLIHTTNQIGLSSFTNNLASIFGLQVSIYGTSDDVKKMPDSFKVTALGNFSTDAVEASLQRSIINAADGKREGADGTITASSTYTRGLTQILRTVTFGVNLNSASNRSISISSDTSQAVCKGTTTLDQGKTPQPTEKSDFTITRFNQDGSLEVQIGTTSILAVPADSIVDGNIVLKNYDATIDDVKYRITFGSQDGQLCKVEVTVPDLEYTLIQKLGFGAAFAAAGVVISLLLFAAKRLVVDVRSASLENKRYEQSTADGTIEEMQVLDKPIKTSLMHAFLTGHPGAKQVPILEAIVNDLTTKSLTFVTKAQLEAREASEGGRSRRNSEESLPSYSGVFFHHNQSEE